jgi:16S rRNA (cytosine967-C5)-methyltransferase
MTVLHRSTDEGAFASRALDAELSRARLSARDAALATEIVYGALRVLPALDARALDRVPPHAVVDETVRFVRERRGPRLAGLVNAVLRKLALEPQPLPQGLCVPDWVREEHVASLGAARARALLDERVLPPPTGLRVRLGTDREQIAERLRAAHPEARILELTVQEEGSQLVACYLGARPGEQVADLCAGHGGKTTLLAEQVGALGKVTAVDLDERKLERIAAELSRLGLPSARVEASARCTAGPSCCPGSTPATRSALPACSSRSRAMRRGSCVRTVCW